LILASIVPLEFLHFWGRFKSSFHRIVRSLAGTNIYIKQRAIVFGHWDWVVGIPMMIPVVYVAGCTLLACIAPIASPALKVAVVMGLTAMTHCSFQFYKSLPFDAFRVGRCYFKSIGLGYFIKA